MVIFKDLLKAMHLLFRNVLMHSHFRKFTDFQNLICELQSKKSCLRDRCDWNWLSGRKKVLAQERLGNQWCLQDCGKPRGLTRQGFYQSSSTKCSQFTKVKENKSGKDISMLACILHSLAMLIVAFGF